MDAADWTDLFQRAKCEAISYEKDAAILVDGVRSEHIYRVIQGTVRVEKVDRRSESGNRPAAAGAIVNKLEAGHTFGEMSFLDDQEVPCATCLADSTDVQVMSLNKENLDSILSTDPELSCKFYRQMAINVTQRLQAVSKASADIREAPRGLTQPEVSLPISAKKLLKIRHRLGTPDSETMACMMSCTMINPSKRKCHGTLYIFESMIGFVHKVFGLKQQEVIFYSSISEVLRETFTLKREDNAIEIATLSNKTYTFYPQHVEEAFEALARCRKQFESTNIAGRRRSVDTKVFGQNPHERTQQSSVALQALIEKATLEKYKPGDVIISDGSRPRTLFNIAKGRVAVEVQRLNEDTQMMQNVKILTLFESAMFGEMSFLNGDVACATVVAEVETEVWQIKAATIEKTFASDVAKQAVFYKHLGMYLAARVRQLTAMVAENYASQGGEIKLEEVLGNAVFFSLFKRFLNERKLVENRLLFFLQELNEFLLMPVSENTVHVARKLNSKYLTGPNAIEISEEARSSIALALASDAAPPRDMFAPVLQQVLLRLQTNAFRLFQQSAAFAPLLDLKSKENYVPCVNDFKLLQILGEGYEGKVLHARKKDCGVMYALKVLDKQILAQRSRRWQLHASRELECLIACDHPYIVRIAYSFQTPQYLYMVQEHVPNHTIAAYLDAYEGRPVREEEVRFIICELVLALAHMHSKQIVYRDLKPANVLIDEDGHLRMVDMGMASRLDPETGRRKSVCGTQRYMAPEMKAKQPYTVSVDWYSLGKLILDCRGREAHADEAAWWEGCGLLELIDGLLVKDPQRRRGCDSKGVRGLQNSPFFRQRGAEVDWAAFEEKKVPTPLQARWYVREPDVTASRQFRNGEDLSKVCEKMQHISLDTGMVRESLQEQESGPGMIENWDYINPRIVYDEYLQSPYHNVKTSGL